MDAIQIAQQFSLGHFNQLHPYISDDIVWEIIGERDLIGKETVLNHITTIERFFRNAPHLFTLKNTHICQNFIIIQGHATFHLHGLDHIIAACDIYEFNLDSQIIKIQSYCIPINQL
ncbi:MULTISPECIES: hypothetical protein [unclassified Acinetobacter]|uniref:hypothetical protein n=1 Tax=unclassified Acinetobacter TaxID=196816 RepID=UPI0007D08CF8|nr:hypothetical protein [Acinetobacter sp. SFD]OAL82495.1 hypothetical protein AY605_12850 [Acinetobacter sp. SFD]